MWMFGTSRPRTTYQWQHSKPQSTPTSQYSMEPSGGCWLLSFSHHVTVVQCAHIVYYTQGFTLLCPEQEAQCAIFTFTVLHMSDTALCTCIYVGVYNKCVAVVCRGHQKLSAMMVLPVEGQPNRSLLKWASAVKFMVHDHQLSTCLQSKRSNNKYFCSCHPFVFDKKCL